MNAILVSVPPEVCERIANGEQTVLLMKRIPKLDVPYKCYIYQSANNRVCNNCNFCQHVLGMIAFRVCMVKTPNIELGERQKKCIHKDLTRGKVIGEFVCNTVRDYASDECPDYNVLDTYGAPCYGLRITDLKIYDTPKELGEFKHCCKHNRECDDCKYWGFQHVKKGSVELLCPIDIPLTRPPATFCYVSEVGE